MALGQHVELPFLGQEFDLHPLAYLLPRPLQQVLLVLGQPALGRSDQIMNRRIALAHLFENFLGGHTPVHHPDPLSLTMERFDPFQKTSQGGPIRGVARHYLISQGKTFGRDHQGDDHLHAVKAFVPAVAILALVSFRKGRGALKIRAGQIIQQHFELHSEEILPARSQVLEERLPVLQQLVQTPIQIVLLGQAEILPQQIGHGTVLKPLPVQTPLAARVD